MVIEVRQLSKNINEKNIFDHVNCQFTGGKIYGIVGDKDSGKTSFLTLLCGFSLPSDGEILWDKKNLIKEKQFPTLTRILLGNDGFLDYLSGLENLLLLANILGQIDQKQIEETLKLVNLYDERNLPYRSYNLNMKKKLGLAQVFMEKSEVMLLDEPFDGLDKKTKMKIVPILEKRKEQGALIIITSNNDEDLIDICDEIYKIEQKKLVNYPF